MKIDLLSFGIGLAFGALIFGQDAFRRVGYRIGFVIGQGAAFVIYRLPLKPKYGEVLIPSVAVSRSQRKIACIKAVRAATGFGLKEAKEATELDRPIILPVDRAVSLADALKQEGVSVTLTLRRRAS